MINIEFYNLKTKQKVQIPEDQITVVTMENGRFAATAESDGTKLFKFISKEVAERLGGASA